MTTIKPCPLRLFDSSLNFIAEIDNFEQAYFQRSQSGCGEFEIEINYNVNFASYFQKDYFVLFGTDYRRIGVIEDFTRTVAEGGKGGQKLTIKGREAKALMARRVIIPASGNNYYAQTAPIETVIKNTVYDQCGIGAASSRQMSILSIATDQARGNTYIMNKFYTNLADDLKTAAESQNPYMGWYLYLNPTTLKLILECNPGTNHSASQSTNNWVIFSSDRDTIKTATITSQSSGYRNVVYTGGQGELANKTIIEVDSSSDTVTGMTRREEYIDESSLQTTTALTNAGTAEINSLAAAINTVDANVLVVGQYTLGSDYDLGDLVTIKEYGTSWDVQITQVQESWEHGNYEIALTLGKAAQTISTIVSDTDASLSQTQSTKGNLTYKETQKTYTITTANVSQTLTEVLSSTIIFSGAMTAARTFTLYVDSAGNGSKKYTVIQSCTGGYDLTITTGASGGLSVTLPSLSSNETTYQTYYVADIICDGTNVYLDKDWQITGFVSGKGFYEKHGNGALICWYNGLSTTASSSGSNQFGSSSGTIYFNSTTWTYPISFIIDKPAVGGGFLSSGTSGHAVRIDSVGLTSANILGWSMTSGDSMTFTLKAIGRWK